MRRISILLLILFTCFVLAAWPQAQKIITFDTPGAGTSAGQGTFPDGITDTGVIIGDYIDSHGVQHGFVRTQQGDITPFDPPDSVYTVAWGANSKQSIVGFYVDTNNAQHGYLRDQKGNFATFDPSGSLATFVTDINDRGEILGLYFYTSSADDGFVRAPDGTITEFHVPGAGTGPVPLTGVGTDWDLNPAGAAAGNYSDLNNVWRAWLRAPDGTITQFSAPDAGTTPDQGQGTTPVSINPEGAITGWYQDSENVFHGFVRAPNGTIMEFDPPDAGKGVGQGTTPASISRSGIITGGYTDNGSVNHGFVWFPHSAIIEFDVPGAGKASGQGTLCQEGNAMGAATGWYIDPQGVAHGFLRLP